MFDICHPTYYNMSQLGCSDQIKLTTAFYVYMELCEVKCYWQVQYKYCDILQLFYLEAKKSKCSPLDTFIPWPAMYNISLDFISSILNELEKEKFIFVFKEGDTTSVYHSICAGISKPRSPEETKIRKQKEEKKFELEREIRRNTANLYERALLIDNNDIHEMNELGQLIKTENEKKETCKITEDNLDNLKLSEINNSNSLNHICSKDANQIDDSQEINSVENSSERTENVITSCLLNETESSVHLTKELES